VRVTFGRDAGAGALRSASPGMPSTYKERGHEAWALRLLGEIAVRADSPDPEAAVTYYGQALSLAGELGVRPLVALSAESTSERTLMRPGSTSVTRAGCAAR